MIYFKMFTYVMVIYHIVDELICVEKNDFGIKKLLGGWHILKQTLRRRACERESQPGGEKQIIQTRLKL